MSIFYITEDQVQAAFNVLEANTHAKTRAAYEYADKRLKVVLAKAELAANGKTASERQATALESDEYDHALREFRLISEKYHEERDKREAASAVADAWRTQESTRRTMGRVT